MTRIHIRPCHASATKLHGLRIQPVQKCIRSHCLTRLQCTPLACRRPLRSMGILHRRAGEMRRKVLLPSGGLEPPTLRLKAQRANRLRYEDRYKLSSMPLNWTPHLGAPYITFTINKIYRKDWCAC